MWTTNITLSSERVIPCGRLARTYISCLFCLRLQMHMPLRYQCVFVVFYLSLIPISNSWKSQPLLKSSRHHSWESKGTPRRKAILTTIPPLRFSLTIRPKPFKPHQSQVTPELRQRVSFELTPECGVPVPLLEENWADTVEGRPRGV